MFPGSRYVTYPIISGNKISFFLVIYFPRSSGTPGDLPSELGFNSDRTRGRRSEIFNPFASLKFIPPIMAQEPPPPYGQENYLEPGLTFTAQRWRDHFQKRDRAFAKTVVKFIASYAKREELFEGSSGYAYRNSEDGKTLRWDNQIGYPATLAFKTKRGQFFLEAAQIDLGKRWIRG